MITFGRTFKKVYFLFGLSVDRKRTKQLAGTAQWPSVAARFAINVEGARAPEAFWHFGTLAVPKP